MHEAADSGDFSRLSDEEAEIVRQCLAYAASVKESLGAGAEEFVESYLPVDDVETTAGYADRIMISKDRKKAHVVDWKFGQNPVDPAETNLQGIAYAMGAVYRFPTIEEITVHFVCPCMGDGFIDTETFTKDRFEELLLTIRRVVARSKLVKEGFAAFSKGDHSALPVEALKPHAGMCLFCDNLGRCPAVGSLAMLVPSKFEELRMPDVINPALISDPKDAAKGLQFFQIMEKLAKSFRSRCTQMAFDSEAGWVPDGYIMTTVERRAIKDKVAFYNAIRPYMTQEELLQCIEFTLGPVEDIIRSKAPSGSKKHAVEQLAEMLEATGATEKSEPFPVLRLRKGNKEPIAE
jgi:hypothetical protein